MDTTTLVQCGVALFISLQMNKKVDALINEFRESNEVTFGLLKTLTGRVDKHDRRVTRIENHLIQRLQEDQEEEDEEEPAAPDPSIKGFHGNQ